MAWTLSEGQCFCIVAGATILGVAAAMAFCFFELRSTQIQQLEFLNSASHPSFKLL